MYFELSPVKKVTKKTALTIDNESEEVEVLSLAPFTPNPKIFFENIEVKTKGTRKLLIKNPTNIDIRLTASAHFPDELDISLNWVTNTIKSQEELLLEISWIPNCEGAWRHTFHLEDGGRIRRDIPVVFKSVSSNKESKKFGTKPKPKKGMPSYVTKRNKSPPKNNKTFKKTSPVKRCVLPNITNVPETVIDARNARTFTFEDGKENFNGNSVLPFVPSNYLFSNSNTDPVFNDSLESPQISTHKPIGLGSISVTPMPPIEDRLQSGSFLLTPVTVTPRNAPIDFNPNYCSTDEKSPNGTNRINYLKKICLEIPSTSREINLSSGTYIKANESLQSSATAEIYVKSPNVSAQANVSSRTYVKANSVGDLGSLQLSPAVLQPSQQGLFPVSSVTRLESLRGQSIRNTIEANLWSDSKRKTQQLRPSAEESYVSGSFNYSLKRNSDSIFNETPRKRAFLESTSGIKDWSKTGGTPLRIAKSTSFKLKIVSEGNGKDVEISRKETKEVYIKNAFLLAAIENFDPFMTTSLYFNDEWIAEQEKYFKNWLNALLTPHTELDAKDDGHPVNMQLLFKECKNKELVVASTKEAVSNKYHTNSRLKSLRKSASSLFRSKEINMVLSKVVSCVDNNKLSIRQDKNIHLDLTLQSEIMSILLSYNPLWLRIGLETIYNEVIPLNSNSDLLGLSSFLMARFFKDPYLIKKYKFVHSPKYNADIKKFILKKFLSLVYFLDEAKSKKIIAHDPCLFSKNTEIKASREALIKFAKEALSGVGDITKYLRLQGYVVQHKQTYINEFNYAVNCLGTDLRDGVRLTRVMEIILLRDGLTSNVRGPAISRLQKVHNVNIVFESLKQANFEILYDISPKDIVEGHKEKTLSFLWQIIHKFHAPLMVKSATTIQKWWRNKPILGKRDKLRETWLRKNGSASKIQLWYRRQKLAPKIDEFVQLARLYIERRQKNKAAIVIQKNVRMYFIRKKFKHSLQTLIKIQSYARRYLIKTCYKQRVIAAVKIQSCVRMFIARKRYKKLKYCVRFVEERFNANKLMKTQKQRYEDLRYAAIKIQTTWRAIEIGRQRRIEFLSLKFAAITIQQQFRANKLRNIERSNYQKLKSAASIIQCQVRATKIRKEYCELRWVTITIQRRFVANKMAKRERENFVKIRAAAVVIQQKFRAQQIMRIEHCYYVKMKTAVINIQRRFRANLQMKSCRSLYVSQKYAAIKIQQFFRSVKLMQEVRFEYEMLRKATVFTQTKFRAKLLMRKVNEDYKMLKNACITIQRIFRAKIQGRIDYHRFQLMKKSTILIQRKFRAQKTMTFVRTEYGQIKTKTVTIQRWYRSQLLMREERNYFIKLKTTTITIQRLYRAKIAMASDLSSYSRLKGAAITLQRRYRAKLAMRQDMLRFNALKQAAIVIQRRYRAQVEMKREMTKYQIVKQAATTIQTNYRAAVAMKTQLSNYLLLKGTTIFVQRRYRAQLAMRVGMKKYSALRQAAILIQRRYRAQLEMKKCSNDYQKLKVATESIQARFRAQKLMKKQKYRYDNLKRAAVSIQTVYRANIAMKKDKESYTALRQATIVMQRRFRATIAMRRKMMTFARLKEAVVVIQTRYRALTLMRRENEHYRRLKSAAIIIQRRYRARLLMKREMKRYTTVKTSVYVIQRYYRARLEMKKQLHDYNSLREAVITVQRRYRASILMKQQTQFYLQLKETTILVQRLYRANIKMKVARSNFVSLRRATVVIQQRYRANISMRKEIENFKRIQEAVAAIQRRYRATLKMRLERKRFQTLKTAAILIQRRYRGKLAMRTQRLRYEKLRLSTIQIQSWYKMIKTRERFLVLRNTVTTVQRRFCAKLQMKIARNDFWKMKQSAIIIQKCYRKHLQLKREQEERDLQNMAAVVIQKNVRRYLVRNKYGAVLAPEAINNRRRERLQNAAATQIQAAWRGHKSRSLEKPEFVKIRSQLLRANETVTTHKKLGYRLKKLTALVTKGNMSIEEIISALEQLEHFTRLCKITCQEQSANLTGFLYHMLTTTARSLPEMTACTLAGEILINFYKYPPTRATTWMPQYLDQLLTVMLHWCDKEDPLFPTLCTLLWLFAHTQEYKNEILNIQDFKQRASMIQLASTRKEKMVSKGISRVSSRFTTSKDQPTPSLLPDWGLENEHRPKLFYNSLHAFNSLMSILMK